MAEVRYDVQVESWSCLVTNQSRKAFGGRKIRQRTVIHLRGRTMGKDGLTAGVYLTFERGAQDYEPSISVNDSGDERLRIDAFFVHGQEAATLAILKSGYATWARFSEDLVGQVAFTLESGPGTGAAPQAPAAAD
jgi:hypothetical protein